MEGRWMLRFRQCVVLCGAAALCPVGRLWCAVFTPGMTLPEVLWQDCRAAFFPP